jgi:hypothetical protein
VGLLNNLIVRIRGDKTQLDSTLKGAESSVSKFGGAVKKIGGVIAAAFSVAAIAAFTKDIIGLASKTEGVKAAFDRLNNPSLLYALRTATRGTVSDLQLMTKAVQAQNFKIPLSQLATYFEFATKRAIQTGESVDYLVDSIITGIGRKSVLVMDNLGISAVQLQKEVERTGDFATAAGNIIRSELTSMGEVADTTATKVASIKTAFENIKTGIGLKITESPLFQGLTNWVNNVGKFAQVPGMSLIQAIYGATIKPEEFNAILDESNKKIAENASLIAKQNEAKAAAAANRRTVTYAAPGEGAFGHLKGSSGVSGLNALPGLQMDEIKINEVTEALQWQEEVLFNLTAAFSDMFANVSGGFDDMIDSLVKSLKRYVQEILARAAVLALLNIIAPGSGMAVQAHKNLGGLIPLGGGKGLFGNRSVASASGPMEFKIYGKDLKTVLQRNG